MRNRKLQLVVGVVVIVVSVTALYDWAMQPSKGTLTETATPVVSATPASTILQTSYYSTVVPGSYLVEDQQDSVTGPVVSSVVATQTGTNSSRLAVTIAEVPSNGLSGVADVRSRAERVDRYERITVAGAPEGAIVFRAKGMNEISLFWPHDNWFAAVVVTATTGNAEQADSRLAGIVQGWKWLR